MSDKDSSLHKMQGTTYPVSHLAAWMDYMELLERLEVYRPGVNSFVWLLKPDDGKLYSE